MIEVTDLVKRYGEFTAVDGISFTAPPGQITGFLGANGAGKTTTMRVLSTLLKPTSGRASVNGFDVVDAPLDVRRSIGLLTEETGLYDRMTAREQLAFFGTLHAIPAAKTNARIDELATVLGLGEHLDRRAAELSKGNRQKVAIARALVHDPSVLLLDEPTAALDVVASDAMEEFIASDAIAGRTVLLSTHVVEEAARLCARIIVVSGGKIVADGSPAELSASAGSLREALLTLMDPQRTGASS
jgi:sodium transport system ATP-binding protein